MENTGGSKSLEQQRVEQSPLARLASTLKKKEKPNGNAVGRTD
jgi:hypothetical protein